MSASTAVRGTSRGSTASRLSSVSLARWQVGLAVVAVVWTALLIVLPALRVHALAPEVRLPFEVAGAGIVILAAILMALPVDAGRPARSALLSGLLVLGVANAVAALRIGVAGPELSTPAAGFASWVAARSIAGTCFLLAGLERPRAAMWRWAAAAILVWVVVEVGLTTLGIREAVPEGVVAVGRPLPPDLAVVQLGPAVVFGIGSWLAARLHRRDSTAEFRWIALALEVQVVAQVHEVLFPAFQGPWITTADLLRLGSFVLLAVGASVQVRRLGHERLATIAWQHDELAHRDGLVAQLLAAADREAHFRTIVGHELATPLATVNAYAHVITRSLADDRLDPRVADAVVGLEAETRTLTELVARMDELREIDLDEVRCRPRAVSSRELLEDACTFARAAGTGHQITCVAEGVRVLADPVRFGQALRNVLTNALRYAPPETPVRVEGAVEEGWYVVRVVDHGPGIAPDDRHRVLDAYVRTGRTSTTPGSGVGLYVASRIMAAHGGTVDVEPRVPGSGTTVRLTLALAT